MHFGAKVDTCKFSVPYSTDRRLAQVLGPMGWPIPRPRGYEGTGVGRSVCRSAQALAADGIQNASPTGRKARTSALLPQLGRSVPYCSVLGILRSELVELSRSRAACVIKEFRSGLLVVRAAESW